MQGVEEVFVGEFEVVFFQGERQLGGEAVYAHADFAQAFGAVPDGVAARHDGEQCLRGADVTGRFFAFAGRGGRRVCRGYPQKCRRGGRAWRV